MANLGSFGVAREAVADTFDYFGTEIRVHPSFGPLLVDEFARVAIAADAKVAAMATASEDEQRALKVEDMPLTTDFVELFVHPDDVAEFWRLAVSHRQTQVEVMTIGHQLIAALTDRPTERPSDSSDGPPSTVPNLKVDSYTRALRKYKGRPDIQQVLLDVKERREALASMD